jgi:hypothetical protein
MGKRRLVMETTYLHQEQLDALRARRVATHVPVSEQIRTAVDQYLARCEPAPSAPTAGPPAGDRVPRALKISLCTEKSEQVADAVQPILGELGSLDCAVMLLDVALAIVQAAGHTAEQFDALQSRLRLDRARRGHRFGAPPAEVPFQ